MRGRSSGGRALLRLLVLFALLVIGFAPVARGDERPAAPAEEGIALAIVYDTSGSMTDSVPDGGGERAPKYVIANRALDQIVDRLQAYVASAPPDAPRRIEAGLFVFKDSSAVPAVRFGPFDPEALRAWRKRAAKPDGPTPLGQAVSLAGQAVLASRLTHKHVLVLTDGVNTAGPEPAGELSRLKDTASRSGKTLSAHFVAFDIDADRFNALRALGATVVGAADARQLDQQFEYILERKILLEDEEPPAKGRKAD